MAEEVDIEEVDVDLTIPYFENVPAQSTPIKQSKSGEARWGE